MTLLADRYTGCLLITNEVLAEILDGIAAGYAQLRSATQAVDEGIFTLLTLSADERQVYSGLLGQLASGEASCIAAALTRQAVVITDDRAARNCCGERGILLTGTLGILKACCQDGALDSEQADAILAEMIRCGFYSPVSRISDLLD